MPSSAKHPKTVELSSLLEQNHTGIDYYLLEWRTCKEHLVHSQHGPCYTLQLSYNQNHPFNCIASLPFIFSLTRDYQRLYIYKPTWHLNRGDPSVRDLWQLEHQQSWHLLACRLGMIKWVNFKVCFAHWMWGSILCDKEMNIVDNINLFSASIVERAKRFFVLALPKSSSL